jgi:glutamine synthetase
MSATTDLGARLDELGIRTLRAGGVDLDGLWRSKQLTAAKAGGGSLSQCNYVFGIDLQDQLYDPVSSYTGWETGWPDIRMRVDPDTVRPLPWEAGVATAICDYVDWDGAPVHLCPRGMLRRVVGETAAAGFTPDVAMELEFFVFEGRPEPRNSPVSVATSPVFAGNHGYHPHRGMDLMERWSRQLQEYGIPIEGALTEWGASQFEINIDHGDPLRVADDIVMTKHALKALAARDGLTVSFMARPSATGPGSSGHVHVSLWGMNDERNTFFDADRPDNASDDLLRFAAGLVRDLPETALVALPFVNSYRRVGDYLSSPTRINVGVENRTTGLRLITHDDCSARLELRVPGADVNPYLILASTLASGLAGIREALDPAPVLRGDGYADTASPPLPRSLEQAIAAFAASKRARLVFGDEFVAHYLHTRRWELAKWQEAVTDWEIDRYLEMT